MTTTTTFFLAGRLWRVAKRLVGFSMILSVLAVPATFFGLPALARSAWARKHVEIAMTRSLGTPVHVESMKWSWREGLKLRDVATEPVLHEGAAIAFHAESARIKPDALKLLRGKPRAKVVFDGLQISSEAPAPGTPAQSLRLPRLRLKLESVKILNGTFTWKDAAYGQSLRIDGLEMTASGKLKKREAALTISSIRGRLDEKPIEGWGMVKLTKSGASGSVVIPVEDPSLSERVARALRPFNLTLHASPSKIH